MFGSPPVVRVVQGRELVGRYVSPEAYASYAEGAYLEQQGKLPEAERAYRRALSEDPDSAAIWTRVGALRCRAREKDAGAAFDRARAIDADYAPLWREKGRCDLSHRRFSAALSAAKKAFGLDPDDEQTTLLMAELFARRGHREDALRWLDALVARNPESLAGWQALLSTAKVAGDRPEELRAARALSRRAPAERADLERRYPEIAPLASADRALLSGRLDDARRHALAAHMPLGELAVRAAELGLPGPAARLADEVLGADPDDTNAWIARLVAADLSGDQTAFNSALARLGQSPATPRRAAAKLLGELLARRSGEAAARSWLAGYGVAREMKRAAGTEGKPPLSE